LNHRLLAFCLTALFLFSGVTPFHHALAQTATGTLRGQVADPTGAVIPQATITVTSTAGVTQTGSSDAAGQYAISGLTPGRYTVTVEATGFSVFTSPPVGIAAGQTQHLNISLSIQVAQQQVEVSGDTPGVSVDPDSNVSAVVMTGKDLDALSDDPDELSNELTALAGPSAGPSGGQIYIDGFTGGQLPPKSAIRAIIINQNPFSAQYDTPGYGRVEILTKPGTDKLHGQIFVNSSASAFNSSNPFAANEPPYHTLQYNGSVSGALGKRASFFLSFDRRNIQDNSIVNANVPYVPDPATCGPAGGVVVPTAGTLCNLAVPYPQTRTDISPRLDYQLTPSQTLTVRYSYYQDTRDNSGLGGNPFVLPSQAFNTNEVENRVQISDSQVYGAKFVNNTRFQYVRDQTDQTPQLVAPAIDVLQNFEGGGSPQGTGHDTETHYEFQDYASMSLAKHYLRFGGRLRNVHDTSYSNANFEGTYTYSNLTAYLANKPSQFSITFGTPTQTASVTDLGLYAEDDWKVRPNFTLSYGLRYETQNHLTHKTDFAPRIALAYGIGGGGKPPKTVLRAGYGIFYNRFTDDLLLNTNRYNLDQLGQVQTIQSNPNGTPPGSVKEEALALPTYYRAQPGLNAPSTVEAGTGIERQVNKSVSLSATYLYSRGIHQFLSRNIDAPLPDGSRPALDLCPSDPIGAAPGTPCNIYEYDSLAIFKENQVFLNLNVRYGRNLTFTGFYVYSKANSDTGGPGYHPSNQYNIGQDYGRQFFDVRNRVFAFANYSAPYGFRISPFLSATSGSPFNLQLSQDNNGDSFLNDRPTFASSASNPLEVDKTKYGNFDISATPPAGAQIIPVNYGNGGVQFAMNMRVAKSFGVGPRVEEGQGAKTDGGGGPGGGGRGGGRGMPGMGLGGSGGGRPGGQNARVDRRYSITLSAFAHNIFNVVNLAPPNGTLGGPPDGTTNSPFFGKSNQLASGFFSHNSAVRDFNFQALFNF
jgi:Carboxypeptidase regulatory-like domain/TonB dependent receptor